MSENKYLKWLSSETKSIYWHDSAVMSELEDAISNGARGVTTNPFLAGSTIKNDPDFWKDKVLGIPNTTSKDERAEELIKMVVKTVAGRLHEFRVEGDFKGYCCIQTNPCMPGSRDYMIEQAKRYSEIADNVVIKMPATHAGIEAIEECAALGFNVAATVSFTVPQVLRVAEAYERGKKRAIAAGINPGIGIAVLMVGRLDDYLRDVMNDTINDATESDVIWAGTATIKRAYQIFNEKQYSAILMPAGCRGGYHITELAGARMVMSIAPKIAVQLEPLQESAFVEKINDPVDPSIINRLLTMNEFKKAYEPDGMDLDDFITFGSCNRTLDQFVNDGWNVLKTL